MFCVFRYEYVKKALSKHLILLVLMTALLLSTQLFITLMMALLLSILHNPGDGTAAEH